MKKYSPMEKLNVTIASSKIHDIHTWGGLVATIGFITASAVAGYEIRGGLGAFIGGLAATGIMGVTDLIILAS